MVGEVKLFRNPRLRPQRTDIEAAVAWSVAATTTALWLVQVSDSLSTQLFNDVFLQPAGVDTQAVLLKDRLRAITSSSSV
ncbi:hypothetical protein CJ030_MR3G002720 [Morella rubra]|uniref:Uncharacterized protein n=1 Tax=Morella rubra TaxID=262757 RepID=A0A6A1VXX1_9ROSI|nr:hypothetical protein CJ030_MR3G002720 [Morella rubra]